MGHRVNTVRVVLERYEEFEGVSTVTFAFAPVPGDDDELVRLLEAKNDALLRAAALADNRPANPFG